MSDLVFHLTMTVETLVCFSCTDNEQLLLNQKSANRMLRWTHQQQLISKMLKLSRVSILSNRRVQSEE